MEMFDALKIVGARETIGELALLACIIICYPVFSILLAVQHIMQSHSVMLLASDSAAAARPRTRPQARGPRA